MENDRRSHERACRKPRPSYKTSGSVFDAERRRILWRVLPAIIEAAGTDVRILEPLLEFGDVRFVLQRVGCGGRAQAMHPQALDIDAGRGGVLADLGVDSSCGQSLLILSLRA